MIKTMGNKNKFIKMRNLIYLIPLLAIISCDPDDFEPKKNEFGTQVFVKDDDPDALYGRYFVFRSITAINDPYDFDGDGNASFDILSQFPECAIDDSYEFQNELFQTKFIGNQCDPGVSPLEGLNQYSLSKVVSVEGSEFFQLIIRNTEDLDQRINIDDFELYENEKGKRTIIGEWISFNPDFVFDVVMTEIDRS